MKRVYATGLLLCLVVFCAQAVAVGPITIDWETEDDFTTPLINGQSIGTLSGLPGETVFEFGDLINVSSTSVYFKAHLGPAIFDSDTGGPNDGGGAFDPDLLVDLGNILILQNDFSPDTILDPNYGLVFEEPNDEANFADRGSIIVDFLDPVELISIIMVDINGNGHSTVRVFDLEGDERIYNVPQKWTTDVTVDPTGWHTLFLNTLDPQPSHANAIGNDATVIFNSPDYNPFSVVRIDVALDGDPASSGIDSIVWVPEATTLSLLAVGSLVVFCRRRSHR